MEHPRVRDMDVACPARALDDLRRQAIDVGLGSHGAGVAIRRVVVRGQRPQPRMAAQEAVLGRLVLVVSGVFQVAANSRWLPASCGVPPPPGATSPNSAQTLTAISGSAG